MDREEKLNGIEIKLKRIMVKHNLVDDLIEQVLIECKKFGFIVEQSIIKEEVDQINEINEQFQGDSQIKQKNSERNSQVDQQQCFHKESTLQIINQEQQLENSENNIPLNIDLFENQIQDQKKEIKCTEIEQNGTKQNQNNFEEKLNKNPAATKQQHEICVYCDKKFKGFIHLVKHLYKKHDIKLTSKDLSSYNQKI